MALKRRGASRADSILRASTTLPSNGKPSLPDDELLCLLRQLREELDAFFDDLGVAREPSRNRESPRRA
jgi:hypothetical protein